MAFKKYTYEGRWLREPCVTVLKTGQLYLNTPFKRIHFPKHNAAFLYFDEERKMIGLEPTNDISGAKIGKQGDRGYAISVKSFLRYYRVNYKISHRYLIRIENGLAIFGPVEVAE